MSAERPNNGSQGMAVQLTIGRVVISAALAISLVVTLAVSFDAAAPVQAGYFPTHLAGTPAGLWAVSVGRLPYGARLSGGLL